MNKKFFASKKGRVILLLVAIVFFIAVVLIIKSLLPEDVPEQKKRVQQITVLAPPPPPPPPPPPEIEEPEIEEEVIEPEMDEALPDEGPEESAAEDLGIDADGSAGGDDFGLVARKGGRGILGGSYSATVRAEINKALLKDEALKFMGYEAIITVWLTASGEFSKVQVSVVEGGQKVAEELERFFAELGGIGKAKPLEEVNNRYRFRVSSKL